MLSYLVWLAIYIWLPTAILWLTHIDLMLRHKKTLVLCAFFALVFAVPWDLFAIGGGVWSFPQENVIGIYVFSMPIEEYLFITFVTVFVSTFTLVARERFGKLLIQKKVKK